jgi:hypothetical protein
MLNRLLPLVALVFWPCYSYSESISPYFGITGNAAIGGYSWNMDNVFPEPPGLEVNGVFYSYTPDKLTEDEFKVTVGNEGVWSDTEDWTGTPGGIEVRKVIGLPNVPREAWGDGYIVTEGTGTVNDATVIYSYKVDPCFDPQFDPNCPGYVTPVPVVIEIDPDSIYDATEDEYVSLNDEEKVLIEENEQQLEKEKEEEEEEAEKLKRAYRLELAQDLLGIVALESENQRIIAMNAAQQAVVNVQYLNATVPGGTYKETVVLVDKKIDDNKEGLRNGLAQQLLHEEMVNMQYQN